MKQRILLLLCIYAVSRAPVFGAITLGTAETFAVLGGSTVTNTGPTDIKGNLGVNPGLAVVGFPPGIMLRGAIHAGDAIAAQAQADLTTAYNALAALPCTSNITGQDLGGHTLTPGVYCFDSSAQLTGALVLDFQGSNRSTFLFQIGSTLTTASNSTVSFVNCSHHCSITWQVGSSATLGTSSRISGNILALASITLQTDVYLCGRALAQTGAVTMDTDKVFFMGYLNPPTVEITGEGDITYSQPNASKSLSGGSGSASFAFTADRAEEANSFDYFDHFTSRRVHGLISDVQVVATGPDGSPSTVQFSGSCDNGVPRCSFTGTLEKAGSSGKTDRFGIAITGQPVEQTLLGYITPGANGRIEFYSTDLE